MLRRALTSVAAVLLLNAPAAQAQTVNFVGSTSFCFSAVSATSCSSYTNSAVLGGLTVGAAAGNSFNVTTFNGFAGISNLGTTVLNGTVFDYNTATNRKLWMRVVFTAPPGSSTPTFESYLSGAVSGVAGGVNVTFSPASVNGTFSGGRYTLTMNNLSLNAPATPGGTTTGQLNGSITAVVPEPSTYVLMGTGMLALFGVARRRGRSGTIADSAAGPTLA
ncbi:MAG: PEP-CTERM sorting domain-containing protein [Gemmatimonadetes bacterium]|nr:PEP-CTERM sorting domain-containing protein [Gemmatimonadota bacterium]